MFQSLIFRVHSLVDQTIAFMISILGISQVDFIYSLVFLRERHVAIATRCVIVEIIFFSVSCMVMIEVEEERKKRR